MNPRTIRAALAERIRTLSTLHVVDDVPDSVVAGVTAVIVYREPPVTYHQAGNTRNQLTLVALDVLLLSSKTIASQGQKELDDYLAVGTDEDKSLITVIETAGSAPPYAPDLGLPGCTAQVLNAHGWGITTVNSVDFWSVRLAVDVRQVVA